MPTSEDIDGKIRRARLMGFAWARAGYDVGDKVRAHAPDWSDDGEVRAVLISAAIGGGRKVVTNVT